MTVRAFGTMKGAIAGFKLRIKPEMDESGVIYIRADLKQYEIDIIKPKSEDFPLSTPENLRYWHDFGTDIMLSQTHYFFTTQESEKKAILLDDFAKVSEIRMVREIPCEEKMYIPKVPKEVGEAIKAYAELTNQNTVVLYTPPVKKGCKVKRRPKIICLFEA